MMDENFESKTEDLLSQIIFEFVEFTVKDTEQFNIYLKKYVEKKKFPKPFSKLIEEEIKNFWIRWGDMTVKQDLEEYIYIHFLWEKDKDESRVFFRNELLNYQFGKRETCPIEELKAYKKT
ncbi:hypothetical protein [Peribacillus sp. SCS-37]|uniref:hypothetical protein n=1 Tax=Paraperibacillus esterisolvens TaxID=3115296 RepID=UPI00390634C5